MYVLIPDRNFENTAEWQKGLDEIGGAQNVLITNYRPDPSWDGHTVAELATAQHLDPAALIVQMVKTAGSRHRHHRHCDDGRGHGGHPCAARRR